MTDDSFDWLGDDDASDDTADADEQLPVLADSEQNETLPERAGGDLPDTVDDEQSLTAAARDMLAGITATVAASVSQSVDEIAPQLRGTFDDVSIPSKALKPLGIATLLIVAALVAGPLLGGDTGEPLANESDPVEGETYEPSTAQTVSINQPPEADAFAEVPETYVEGDPPSVETTAGSQTMRVETRDADEPQLVLEDDRNSDGRWVSLPADWASQFAGETPSSVVVENEDGTTSIQRVEQRDGELMFYVPHFSTNIVTFGGEISISDAPATDGTTHTYSLTDVDAVDSVNVSVTGVTNTETETKTIGPTMDASELLVVSGNLDPDGVDAAEPTATVTGGEKLYGETWSGVDGDTISVAGDDAARNGEITFTGAESFTSASYDAVGQSAGATTTIDVGGNVPAEDASVTFTGVENTGSQTTVSGTSGQSLNPDGNLDPSGPSANGEPVITFFGTENRQQRSYSGTDIGLSATQAIEVSGNIEPEGAAGQAEPQLSLTASLVNVTHNPAADEGNGPGEQFEVFAGWDGNGDPIVSGISVTPSTSGELEALKIGGVINVNSAPDPVLDIYIKEESGGPTFDKSSATLISSQYNYTVANDQTVNLGSNYTVTAGTQYTIIFETTGAAQPYLLPFPQASDVIQLSSDYSSGSNAFAYSSEDGRKTRDNYADVTLTTSKTPQSVSVSGDGGATSSFGDFSPGETKTRALDLRQNATEVSISASGDGSLNYSLVYDDVTYTDDPAVDINGDGALDAGTSGVLAPGETTTVPLAGLTNSAQTVDTSLSAGATPDWEITYAPTSTTDSPSLDVDGDGTAEASVSGTLNADETATVDISETIGEGSTDITTQTATGVVDWEISASEIGATEDPSVDLDGDGNAEASTVGILRSGETATATVSEDIPTGTRTVDTAAVTGPAPDWQLTADEVEHARDIALDLDDDGSTEASVDGPLGPDETDSVSLAELTPATDSVRLSAADAPASAEINYVEKTQTDTPTVTINGETTEIASGQLDDAETAIVTVNGTAIQSGKNTVTVGLADDVLATAPQPQVDFEYSHDANDQQTVDYEAGTWTERYETSRAFATNQTNATLTIPFKSNVVAFRSVEKQVDNGAWQSVDAANRTLDGTTAVIDLGSVASGQTVAVRANASAVRTPGEITVLDASAPDATQLDTEIRLDQTPASGPMYIATDDSQFSERVHYATNASWEADSTMTYQADGTARLELPNAQQDGVTGVTTWPVEVSVASDSVEIVDRNGTRDAPGVVVRGEGDDRVEFTFTEAADDTKYALYSETENVARATGTASSPLTLVDDNSNETLVFREDTLGDSTASAGGGGGGGGGGPIIRETGPGPFAGLDIDLTPAVTILVSLAGVLGALVVSRRLDLIDTGDRGDSLVSTGRSTLELLAGNEIIVGGAILAGGAWVATSGILSEQATLVIALGSVPVALYLGLEQFGRFDFRVWAGSTAVLGVLGLNVLAPELFEQVTEQAGVIIVAGVILLGWQALSAWRAEANTPDEVNRIEITDDD